jgi:hypothetical protein
LLIQPADIEWKKLVQKGDVPSARSGHSLTKFGTHNYILYGGLEDAKNGNIRPNGDIYIMKMGPSKYTISLTFPTKFQFLRSLDIRSDCTFAPKLRDVHNNSNFANIHFNL